MKTQDMLFSIHAIQIVLKGFELAAAPYQGNKGKPATKAYKDLKKAVSLVTTADTAIVVRGTEEYFQAIHKALSTASVYSDRNSTPKEKVAFSRIYTEVSGKCTAAAAYVRYGSKCQYCGKEDDARILLTNLGACRKASCVRASMQDHL